jgi:uncharacterized protein YjcR
VNREQLPPAHHKIRRKRGGQKGNQNARTHGFYSGDLDAAEISEFWNITASEDIDSAIALIRVKLQALLEHDPSNRRALGEASKLLVKWYSATYHLNRGSLSISTIAKKRLFFTKPTLLCCPRPDRGANQ